jgi:hypothetical protein
MVIISAIVVFAAGNSSLADIPALIAAEPQSQPADESPIPPRPLDTPLPVEATNIPQTAAPIGGQPTLAPLPPEMAVQMDEIQQQVSSLRGLVANQPVNRGLISPAALQEKVETDFFKDYSDEDAEEDAVVLSVFGLLPRNYALKDLYLDLYSEQIAGFYDNETKEMFVVQGASFGGTERMTYAHEFTHVLQDQNYDLRNGLKLDDDYCKEETEYCAAVTALVEGDATLTESRWLQTYATDQDRADIQAFYSEYRSPVYDAAPEYMQKDFLFAYMQGLEFVSSLVDRGGFGMIMEAYRNPPVSTEQILHPDKYPADAPVKVDMPDFKSALGDGWKELDSNVLGEWYTFLVLSYGDDPAHRVPERTARAAAAGWGGDRYLVYIRESDKAVVLALQSRWDTENDAREFYDAMKRYGESRWGSGGTADGSAIRWKQTPDGEVLIQQRGADTLWLIAPEDAEFQSILTIIPAFQP